MLGKPFRHCLIEFHLFFFFLIDGDGKQVWPTEAELLKATEPIKLGEPTSALGLRLGCPSGPCYHTSLFSQLRNDPGPSWSLFTEKRTAYTLKSSHPSPPTTIGLSTFSVVVSSLNFAMRDSLPCAHSPGRKA